MLDDRIGVLLAASGLALATSAMGQADTFPPVVDLNDLDGVIGFSLQGGGAEAFFGRSVGGGGDLNGDGYDDLIVGSPRGYRGGAAYVYFGGEPPFMPSVDVGTLTGVDGFRVEGIDSLDGAGWDVCGGVDFNADGIDDVWIGANKANPGGRRDAGEVYVVFGVDTGLHGPFSPRLDAVQFTGEDGARFGGIDAGDEAGGSLTPAGDVNGDGLGDVIIGALRADGAAGADAGEAYVVYGRDTVAMAWPPSTPLDELDAEAGFTMRGDAADERAGTAVASAGDVNGDGYDDIIVGANGRGYFAGIGYVVLGQEDRTDPEVELGELDGTDGFALIPPAGVYGGCGQAVAGLGDINGDGIDDLAIASPYEAAGGAYAAGVTRMVFGRADGFLSRVELADLNGDDGFKIEGELEFDLAGHAIDSGDVNGDGLLDIILAAPFGYGTGAQREAGRVYVLFGDEDGFPPVVRLGELDGTNGFRIDGAGVYDRAGFDAAVAGDVNGDGVDDIIVGTYPGHVGYGTNEERGYVVFGRQGATSCPADLDGDGELTIFDFLEFQNLFDAMDRRADFDGDGAFTIFDFLAFQNAFDAGCP